ncbi:hypothetical protein ACFU7Y_27955, partial [Kitasatospora sp. NPDC057542]
MTAFAAQASPARFAPGSTAVRRDVHAGRIWTAMPQRVIDDTGDTLQLAYRPGITSLASTTWVTAPAPAPSSTPRNSSSPWD